MLEKQQNAAQYVQLLKKNPLFQNEVPEGCVRHYQKGNIIFQAGSTATEIGVICTGGVHVFTEDFLGNRNILAALTIGDIFGEAFVCAGVKTLPVSVMAVSDTAVFLFRIQKPSASFTADMLRLMAQKNVALSSKVELLSRRTTREKLTTYLSAESLRQNKRCFCIPFDRQALADFLCVERSAMSAELSKMQQEGLLITKRNTFTLLNLKEESDAFL